jgi:hypothetical protein
MPPQKNQDQQVQDAMHNPEAHINLPQRSKAKTVWMVIAIISIIALIAVSAFGYYKWKQYKTLVGDLGARINALENQVNDLNSQIVILKTTNVVVATASYYEIKDWGVRFKQPAKLAGLVSVNNTQAASFSTLGLMSLAYQKNESSASPFQKCNPNENPIGGIQRGKAGQEVNGTTYDKVQGAIKIGEYYYSHVGPQSTCSNNSQVTTLETEQASELTNAVKTLEAIPAKQ